MSKALLQAYASSEKKSSVRYSLSMVGLGFGVEDKLQLTTLKAVCNEPGLPKKKHVIKLMETLAVDLNKWEEILLNMDALSSWSTDKIVTCKVFVTILQLLQCGPTLIGMDSTPLKVLTTSIQDHWVETDNFLFEFGLFLNQRISFLEENPNYHQHFNHNTMSSNGLSLPPSEIGTVLPIVSRLLSVQGKLVNVLKLPFSHERDNTSPLRRNELFTYKCALSVLYEDAYVIHVALTCMLQFIQANAESFSGDMLSSFVEQYSELFTLLGGLHAQITTADCGEAELSKLPATNPLLQHGASSRKSGAK